MRVEILNGVERRRRWSEDEKARIIEESFTPGAKVSDVARKHGVSRGLIFAWRKEARVDGLAIYWLRVLPFLAREEQRAEQGFDVSQCQ